MTISLASRQTADSEVDAHRRDDQDNGNYPNRTVHVKYAVDHHREGNLRGNHGEHVKKFQDIEDFVDRGDGSYTKSSHMLSKSELDTYEPVSIYANYQFKRCSQYCKGIPQVHQSAKSAMLAMSLAV
ncbi:hypothetical protein BHYA_0055g00240 [Botrytis hyacinthi]|uniref:Uncharacterized protein n=1 Tax=Botrytis hyacinthi TaxID=278943 RepID=A0A4Z1GVK8_9HELO|nr:hypothetical protein BHYA_0055g00240 [Botrytis hyacinthi]